MSNIKRLKDKDGNYIYPVTHVSAVFDDDGRSLNDITLGSTSKHVIYPSDFGAVGDGVEDDTASLIDCLEYAKNNNCQVSLEGKTYSIGDTVEIDNVRVFDGTLSCNSRIYLLRSAVLDNVKVIGTVWVIEGWFCKIIGCEIQGTIRCQTMASYTTIKDTIINCRTYGILWDDMAENRIYKDKTYECALGRGITITGCEINVLSGKQGGDAIEINAPIYRFSEVYVRDNVIKFADGVVNEGASAIGAIGAGFAQCDNLYIENNTIDSVSNNNGMIHLEWCDNAHVYNNTLTNCVDNAIWILASENCYLKGNMIDTCEIGINLVSELATQYNVVIEDNTICNYSKYGIYGTGCSNSFIRNNRIIKPLYIDTTHTTVTPIFFYIATYGCINNSIIANNVFSKNGYEGTFNLPIRINSDEQYGRNNSILDNEGIDFSINYYNIDCSCNFVRQRIANMKGSFGIAAYNSDIPASAAYYGSPMTSNENAMIFDIKKGAILKGTASKGWEEYSLLNDEGSNIDEEAIINDAKNATLDALLVPSNNLLLNANFTEGKYDNNGALTNNAQWASTDLIPIDMVSNETLYLQYYTLSTSAIFCHVSYYNESKTFLSQVNTNGGKLEPPENTHYVRIGLMNYTEDRAKGTWLTYGEHLVPEHINDNYINKLYISTLQAIPANNSVTKETIVEDSVYAKHMDIFTESNNLIDITSYIYNAAINSSGKQVSSDQFILTPYIDLDMDEFDNYYIHSLKNSIVGILSSFNGNKFISNIDITTTGKLTFPESTTRIRLAFLNSDSYDKISLTIGSSYDAYKIKSQYLEMNTIKENVNRTWYYNKKITAFGDSITEQATWFLPVSNRLGCGAITNCGIGGTTVANNGSMDESGNERWMCSDYRINTIPEDSDVILIFGGHNDCYTTGLAIGTIKDEDDTTFMGAYKIMIQKLVNKFPNAELIAMTPVGGRTMEKANQNMQFETEVGKNMTAIANAVKEVCAYYAIPCIDVNAESGISTLNNETYITDLIHPNAKGGERIARCVVRGLLYFEPLS